jgi:hypothetical protein
MNFRRYAVVLSGILLLGGLFGCGSASNNDQGVAFLFTGFFSDVSGGTGLTGLSVPLTSSTGNDTEDAAFGGSVVATMGVQNNLAGQGIQVQRVYLSFFIPGASAQPPSTSYGLGIVLGPSSLDPNHPTTLPPGYNVGATGNAQVPVLPFEVRTWMAFNKARLPEPPFALDVTAFATGITTAGDRLDTNQGLLTITITPEITIPPSSGDGSGGSGSSSSSGAATGDGSDGSTDGSFQ